jgi:hypothetical protein
MTRNEVRGLENLNPVDDGDKFENPATTSKDNANGVQGEGQQGPQEGQGQGEEVTQEGD